jgi:hypothetical protein
MTSKDYAQEWLVNTTIQMVASVDQSVSISVNKITYNGALVSEIKLSQISESTIDKLVFLVNTEKSNAILEMKDFVVYLGFNNEPLLIPGIAEVVIKMFKRSDTQTYINTNLDTKIHYPFLQSSTTTDGTYANFNEFVSKLTKLLPDVPDLPITGSTNSTRKFYQVTLIAR